MSIADQYGLKVEYGSLLKSSPAKKQGKPDKQLHEIFEDEKPKAPPASKAKPIVQQLQEKIEAVKIAPRKKGRPKKGEKAEKLVPITLMVSPDLAEKMKSTKDWQDWARKSLEHAF